MNLKRFLLVLQSAFVSVSAGPAISHAISPPTNGTIAEVVVYADRALITRTIEARCADDSEVVRFSGLPAKADRSSLHAEASGARVAGRRWLQEPVRPTVSPLHEKRLGEIAAELRLLRARNAVAVGSLARAGGYVDLLKTWAARALWREGASGSSWADAVEAVLSEETAVTRERVETASRIRVLEREQTRLTREWKNDRTRGEQGSLGAEVHLHCQHRKPATVVLRYLVEGAGWEPIYEARAREDSGDVDLLSYASVRQDTGEDWEGVRLSLSTARPTEQAAPPELLPVVVESEDFQSRRRIVADAETIESLPTTGAMPSRSPVQPGRASSFVNISVPELAAVVSGGAAVRLALAQATQASSLRLRAIPRLAPTVFRVAELVNRLPLPILPGRIELYRDDAFMGSHALEEEVPCGRRFTVGFGAEERVRIGRLILREVQKDGGFLNQRRVHAFHYRFELTSHLSEAVRIEVLDHLPISEIEGIAVILDAATTGGHVRDPRDGIMRWTIRLRPREERSLDLAFRVEIPKDHE